MVIVRPILSVVLSMVLVIGGVPAIAFADSVDDSVSATDSELSSIFGNNAGSEQSAEEEPGSLEEDTDVSIDELARDSELIVQGEEADEVTANSNEVDPNSENSWRYLNGNVVSSQEGASTNYISLNDAVSTRSMVTNPNGYKVFNWFDQFSNGYYTGTNAYKGIDVSYHNGTIDWVKVKASGVDYAIIRCGYGMDQRDQDDTQWLNNVRGCLNNNIPFGVYIYSYATTTSRASSEADHVLRLLSEAGLEPSDLGYPIYFDMEDASTINSDHVAIAKTFCNKIEAAGYEVGIYSNKSWFNNRLTDPCFNNWTKWVAEWNASSGLTYDGLSNFTSGNGMWQFSDYGSVPGVGGACDLNYTFMEPHNLSHSIDIVGVYPNVKCQLINVANPDLVLTCGNEGVSGANVYVEKQSFQEQQYWYLIPCGNNYCYIQSAISSECVLDAASATPVSGANVSIWNKNGQGNQKWLFNLTSELGEYTIAVQANSDLVLDAESVSPVAGSNVSVFSLNGQKNQQWKLAYDLGGATVSASEMLRNATGNPLKPSISASFLGKDLIEGEDYRVLYNGNETAPSEPGRYEVSIEGKGSYTGAVVLGDMIIHEPLNVDSSVSYNLSSVANDSLVLDATGVNPISGAEVTAWMNNGQANQAWNFELDEAGYYTIRNTANNSLVLDATGAHPQSGANITAWVSNDQLNQKWVVVDTGNGAFEIINAANQKLTLDVASKTPSNGADITAWVWNGQNNQKWNLIPLNDLSKATVSASEMLRNATGNPLKPSISASFLGKDLIEGEDYRIYYGESEDAPADPGNYQIRIEGTGKYTGSKMIGEMRIFDTVALNEKTSFKIINAANPKLVLDATGAMPQNGANVTAWVDNGQDNQKWVFNLDEKGFYTISNESNPSLILDATAAIPVIGANVTAWVNNDQLNQKWVLVKRANGNYVFYNAANPKLVLDATGAMPQNGANVTAWVDNGQGNQEWKIVRE